VEDSGSGRVWKVGIVSEQSGHGYEVPIAALRLIEVAAQEDWEGVGRLQKEIEGRGLSGGVLDYVSKYFGGLLSTHPGLQERVREVAAEKLLQFEVNSIEADMDLGDDYDRS
jgi:hypothetical protein